jgi:hypothetical protein
VGSGQPTTAGNGEGGRQLGGARVGEGVRSGGPHLEEREGGEWATPRKRGTAGEKENGSGPKD